MKGTIMDKTDKKIVTTTATVATPLVILAVVLKIKSRKLGNKIKLREEVLDLLQKAKDASTEDEQNKMLAAALNALDTLDHKMFSKTFTVLFNRQPLTRA
jgi:hypothetical protein